uniref:EF-hand domain-containing protein n=1 Tax=Meloidogyne incognita TaxID=6306 RepID=A0A914M3D8_MELIC
MWFVFPFLIIVMRALGLEPRQEEVNKLMDRMLEDSVARSVNREAFTAQELANILSDRLKIDKIGDEIQTAFQLFDSNEKGFINVEDLKRVAKELGEELNEDEFKEMISLAECSIKGQVTPNEFKNVMKKISLY